MKMKEIYEKEARDMQQKEVFLKSEGDAWYARNKNKISTRQLPASDLLLAEIIEISSVANKTLQVLEIGCGDGSRLAWIKENLDLTCTGLDPSSIAVDVAKSKGLSVQKGSADALPFENNSFDLVIFGFCLYLCDREDLFRIAMEADRVLRRPGWLMIIDFYSAYPNHKPYHHSPGLKSYKMDYRSLFTWHPDYECMTHKIRHHDHLSYTDDQGEWTSVSVIRKI